MTRWLGSIVFLWHHKITRVVFKGLIPYLAFCLGEGKCKGTVHFFRQHLCHSFLPLYIYLLLQNTHHLSEFTNKAMLVIFIWRLIYELVIPEPKHKFFPNSSQFSPQPADLEVQSFEQIHPFFCIAVFLYSLKVKEWPLLWGLNAVVDCLQCSWRLYITLFLTLTWFYFFFVYLVCCTEVL